MIDILIPCQPNEQKLVGGIARQLSSTCGAPHRLILATSGVRDDFPLAICDVESLASPTENITYKHMHLHRAVKSNTLIERLVMIPEDLQSLFLIVNPVADLRDKDWFGKIKRVFDVDPRAGALMIPPGSTSISMHPNKLLKKPNVIDNDMMFACRRDVIPLDFDWKSALSVTLPMALMPQNFSVWYHAGIPFTCRDRSEAQGTQFASPSPTTAD